MPSTSHSVSATGDKLARACRAAGRVATLSTVEKNTILSAMAEQIVANQDRILAANEADMAAAADLPHAVRERLFLNPERVAAMADGVRSVIGLADPVNRVLKEWTRPNGLRIRKVSVPLGVIGVIYESRPNVTVDAAALAFKAGSAIVLRGGREAAASNEALVEILSATPGVPESAIELLDSASRESVEELIRAREFVDVLIPRGGAGLIAYVTERASIPVIETGAGNCHIYVDESADFDMADRIILNAKTQRPAVCNSAEKLLVHERIAPEYVPRIIERLRAAGVEVRGDERTLLLAPGPAKSASPEDWSTEYLDMIIALHVVRDLEEAITHINTFSTKHSEAIITRDEARALEFLRRVDSAAVYWNASTRFTDGAEFGFGAEMGISTQKLHCRGPFALAELTSTKYQIFGSGQARS